MTKSFLRFCGARVDMFRLTRYGRDMDVGVEEKGADQIRLQLLDGLRRRQIVKM